MERVDGEEREGEGGEGKEEEAEERKRVRRATATEGADGQEIFEAINEAFREKEGNFLELDLIHSDGPMHAEMLDQLSGSSCSSQKSFSIRKGAVVVLGDRLAIGQWCIPRLLRDRLHQSREILRNILWLAYVELAIGAEDPQELRRCDMHPDDMLTAA
eukprot:765988-Hanusia_phi.AAC.25